MDLLRSLLAHVKELDEPYRSTVLLHYFDGLTPKEVAAGLRVPYATVRTRLHRAIQQLREKMDADHSGDRRAWLVPLVPFAAAALLLMRSASLGKNPNRSDFSARASHCSQEQVRANCAIDKE